MRKTMRVIFSVVTILLTAAVVLQLYFAGMGVFSVPEDELFIIHGTNGRVVLPILVLLTVLFAALARSGRKSIWLSVSLIGLLVFQTLIFIITGAIFNIGPGSPEIPLAATMTVSLHALGGLTMIWVASILVRRSWLLAYRDEIPGKAKRADAASADAATEVEPSAGVGSSAETPVASGAGAPVTAPTAAPAAANDRTREPA